MVITTLCYFDVSVDGLYYLQSSFFVMSYQFCYCALERSERPFSNAVTFANYCDLTPPKLLKQIVFKFRTQILPTKLEDF